MNGKFLLNKSLDELGRFIKIRENLRGSKNQFEFVMNHSMHIQNTLAKHKKNHLNKLLYILLLVKNVEMI